VLYRFYYRCTHPAGYKPLVTVNTPKITLFRIEYQQS